ncbi:MFS transporter [Nocardia sp. NPDC058114]|uniref:MFS transporter n=1 Tax=Nocardia sp. NPDC058114 TaxID=3346346 RepID=UPI0036DBA428
MSRWLTVLLAITCGVTSSNIYLTQPLLPQIGADLGATAETTSLVLSATQIGYALGILLLVPLGDIRDRRPLILTMMGLTGAALVCSALAPSITALVVAGFLVGLFTPIPQVVIPLAVLLGGDAARGRTVGILQAGLLIGIVCSRAYAGAMAEWVGWRSAYWCSLAAMIVVTVLLLRALPSTAQSTESLTYPQLIRSMAVLIRRPAVAGICVSGGLVGIAFGAFWSTITFELHSEFGFGSAALGAFGMIAAVSALASPVAGRIADQHGVRLTQTALISMLVVGWLVIAGPPGWPVVVLGAILIDVGLWGNQVVNQAALFGAAARDHSRLNTLYFFTRFAGISAGSALGPALWAQFGWHAVVALGIGASVVALGVFAASTRNPSTTRQEVPA